MEYLHFHSQSGGKGCQNWAIPSVPFPGFGNSVGRRAGGDASLPGVSPGARNLIGGSQVLPGVARALWPILQMRKQAQGLSQAAAGLWLRSAEVPWHQSPQVEGRPYTTCWTEPLQEWGAVGYGGSLALLSCLPML